MSCPHASMCPLFPKLKVTLDIWRKSYCDSEERYPTCVRYKLTLQGKAMPITLLPNGKDLAAYLKEK